MSEITFRGKTIKYEGQPEFWESLPGEGWEPETFNVLERFLGPGKVFMDIGGWNGVLSIYASLLGAECFTYEPDPVAFKELVTNASINHSNITVAEIAIAMSNGRLALRSEQFGNSMSSLLQNTGKQAEMVSTATLESSMQDLNIIPDLIKIDAEGAEYVIVPFSIPTLQKTNCPLLLSLHPHLLTNEEVASIWSALGEIYDLGKTEKLPHEQYLFQK